MAQDYSLQPVVKELDTPYKEKKLEGIIFLREPWCPWSTI